MSGISRGDPLQGGEDVLISASDGFREVRLIREQVTGAASSSKSLQKTLPKRSRVLWAAGQASGAITLATAVRLGLGIASVDADKFLLSSTTMATGTKWGPEFNSNPGAIFSNTTASAAITNTNTETAFSFTGQTIPSFAANSLKPGDVIRIRGHGIATATNSTDTLAIKVYLGSALVALIAARDVADNDTFAFDAVAIVRAVGSSGTYVAMAAQPVSGAGKSDGTSAITYRMEFQPSTSLDTTASISPSVKATWSVASTSNSCRLDLLTIEHIRPSCSPAPISVSAATTVAVIPVDSAGNAAGTFTGDVNCWILYERLRDIPELVT